MKKGTSNFMCVEFSVINVEFCIYEIWFPHAYVIYLHSHTMVGKNDLSFALELDD